MLEINFFLWVASTYYLVFKVVAKLTSQVATIDGHITAQLPPIVRFMSKQNSKWSKAFDHMELNRRIISLKMASKKSFSEQNSQLFATHIFNWWQMGFAGSKFATCYC